MPKSFEDMSVLLDRIWESQELEEAFGLVDTFGRDYGFNFTALACFGRMLTASGSPMPMISTEGVTLTNAYFAKGYFEIDPVVQMAKRSTVPFTAKDAFIDPSPAELEFKLTLEDWGVADRFVFPVHLKGRPSGLIVFHTPKKIEISQKQMFKLTMVCQAAYRKVMEFFQPDILQFELKLSEREHHILTLVARGKTNWEIGAVLSISEFSVRDYLKGLSKKLETSNRAHTAARAIQLGLILP